MYLEINSLLQTVQDAVGRPLTEEEAGDVELWRKGRDLREVVNTPAWTVLLEMLQSYTSKALQQLVNISPGDNDRVLAAQAVAYAVNDLNIRFRRDVEEAVERSQRTPEIMTQGLHLPGPINSLI